jgi:ABC-type uncharacterized transport system involved in gliding motility auxiliary subunit
MTATSIDKDLNVLLVIHPRDILGATEYALDQFVLRGGKLVVFVIRTRTSTSSRARCRASAAAARAPRCRGCQRPGAWR